MSVTRHRSTADSRVGRKARWPVSFSWAFFGTDGPVVGIYVRLRNTGWLIDWTNFRRKTREEMIRRRDERIAAYERENA